MITKADRKLIRAVNIAISHAMSAPPAKQKQIYRRAKMEFVKMSEEEREDARKEMHEFLQKLVKGAKPAIKVEVHTPKGARKPTEEELKRALQF